MISQKVICDRCKAECNGDGFAVTHKAYEDRVVIMVEPFATAINTLSHYCGKQCLMMAINEMVDLLRKEETCERQ